ncbi:hypothetical protein GCM10007425_12570 [Lysinibacillus alkalisoli]|uniref:Fido domain-containing protein n=1 Tax=Lysinibacillus alkalisoli TaxID=1911548 RepID=A0A917LFX7_9BACI|nr:Fic family protein [Lysinibacillus alkalisoli]GGG19604.1 hypothetical protein GCM10007425_12570 [Lysinibacillus alkalisoli]
MDPLYKIFSMKTSTEFNREYEKRREGETTVVLKLAIKPMNQSNIYPLYFIPTLRMFKLSQDINKYDALLKEEFEDLPEIAKDKYILESIINELQNTNEIEGVRSSKEELVRSARALAMNKKTKARFTSMIHSYSQLMLKKLQQIDKIQDIRTIYDYLLKEEIDEKELPDGDIFRKDKCVVLKKSGTQKEIHQGVYPEKEIKNELENMLAFLNEEEEIPLIIKVIIGHYYFGYIHPFYDGNGRTSRFISSLYLQQEYSEITSISLSRGCNFNAKKYLSIFENTNKFSNAGELNEFIETMLEIINETQKTMLGEVKEKSTLLNLAKKAIEEVREKDELIDLECSLLYILAQDYLFAPTPGLQVNELKEIIHVGSTTARKTINGLVNKGYVLYEGNRPKIYKINKDFLESN